MCPVQAFAQVMVLLIVFASIVAVIVVAKKTNERSQKAWDKVKKLTKEQGKQ